MISIRIKPRSSRKPTESFPIKITQYQRDSLILCTELKPAIKKRIESAGEGTQVIEFTRKELDHLNDEIGRAAAFAKSPGKKRLMAVLKKVVDAFEEEQLAAFGIKGPKQRPPESDLLFQFKITLANIEPPIWRRIHIQDCTLDKLHELIQTAMGWTNSHLHQFEIQGERYGDPQLLDDGFYEFDCIDSTITMLSDIVPEKGKPFSFKYEYDFGDDWIHEIRFEGYPPVEKRKKYPVCVEGQRACPPEDVGGPWGYLDFLTAIADPKHEEHDNFMEWIGPVDPEEFDPKQATRSMKKGLPDWRDY